jgi:hypothetical protein
MFSPHDADAASRDANFEPPRPLMRELAPADPFPVDALGDVLAPAAYAIHDRVQAPLAICGQSVLAAATLAVQAHANIELPNRQTKPLANYYLTVAASGELKTSVDAEALWPIRKREEALRGSYEAEQLEYQNAKLAWDKARDKAVQAGKGDCGLTKSALDKLGPPPAPPLNPLLTCSEPTFEGLTRLLADGLPSIGIFVAEGGQFIGGHGMSDDAKLRTASGLSAIWDGEPIKRVRRGDGVVILPGRCLTMHLMAQPAVACVWLNDPLLADQGMLSRVLPTAPNATSGTRRWREQSPNSDPAMKRYGARLLAILERPLPLAPDTRNELSPPTLAMSSEARQMWIGFYNHVEERLKPGGELEEIRGFGNKLAEHAVRIAAVLLLVEDIEASEVGGAEMERGISLAQHYATEALRLFGASRVRHELFTAQQLLHWLTTWQEELISLPDVYQLGPNPIREMASAKRAVTLLEEHGWLIRVQHGACVAGKFRREVWRIVRA